MRRSPPSPPPLLHMGFHGFECSDRISSSFWSSSQHYFLPTVRQRPLVGWQRNRKNPLNSDVWTWKESNDE